MCQDLFPTDLASKLQDVSDGMLLVVETAGTDQAVVLSAIQGARMPQHCVGPVVPAANRY